MMRRVTLTEAKPQLLVLVEWAACGESIGITKRGKLAAVIGPVREHVDLNELFAGMEAIRKRAKKMPSVTIRSLIEGGRM